MTAYLAENTRDRINYAKLGRALAMKSADEPMVQAGTTAITEAQRGVRNKLSGGGGDKVDSPDNVLPNFLAYCVKFNYTFEKLFDQGPVVDIPIIDFVEKLEQIDFKTDYQQVLIDNLDKKKTQEVINATYLNEKLNKEYGR